MGPQTLFQASARRLAGPDFADPVVMTNADFRFIVAEQLEQAGIRPGAIVIEPILGFFRVPVAVCFSLQ